MTQQEAIEQIEKSSKEIALQMMKLQPAVFKLEDEATRDSCLKSAHQLTVELEVIKKKIIQLQNRDDSPQL